jgi:hypothetical protein
MMELKSPLKFKRGDCVHVSPDLPPWMKHFERDFDGIVWHSDGGHDPDREPQYNVIQLNEHAEPIDCYAWYPESALLPRIGVPRNHAVVDTWEEIVRRTEDIVLPEGTKRR